MVEVAVNERGVARMHRRVDLLRLTHEVVIARVIEPAGHEVADPAKRASLLGRAPDLPCRRDGDAYRFALREVRCIEPRTRALDQDRAARAVAPQKSHRTVTVQQLEGIRLVIGLIVLDGHDFEDGILPGERDEREPARDETLTQGNTPVARDLRRRGA